MNDYPYTKEGHLFNAVQMHAGQALDAMHNQKQMRQLSMALIISVPEDMVLYEVSVLNSGNPNKRQAYLLSHPNYWNIVGYPMEGDTVLLMHQYGGNDAHILMKIQDKQKPILTETTVQNSDGITPGPMAP